MIGLIVGLGLFVLWAALLTAFAFKDYDDDDTMNSQAGR